MKTVDRDRVLITRSKIEGVIVLSFEISDVQWAYAPEKFQMRDNNGRPRTFHKSSTNYCGTIDNEVVGWTYICYDFKRSLRVEIHND